MGSCFPKKTTKNVKRSCEPATPGVRPIIFLGFISQLVGGSLAYADGDDKIITGIPMKTGEKLTTIEGYKSSHAFSTGFNVTESANYIPHILNTIIYDRSSSGVKQADILTNITDAFFVAKENGLTGNWRVFGIKTGAACTGQSSTFNDANGAAIAMTFEAANEIEHPLFLKHMAGALEDTETYLQGLAYAD